MKLKNIPGVFLHALSIDLTKEFYVSLGFRVTKNSETHLVCQTSRTWLEFQHNPEHSYASVSPTPSIAVSVDSIEEYYRAVLEHGYHPESVPAQANGRLSFTLKDPNGYLLTFVQAPKR